MMAQRHVPNEQLGFLFRSVIEARPEPPKLRAVRVAERAPDPMGQLAFLFRAGGRRPPPGMMSHAEIGVQLGISRARVQQIEKRALRKLAAMMEVLLEERAGNKRSHARCG